MGVLKPIATIFVMLLVVGIAIGLIVGVRDSNSGNAEYSSTDNDLSSTSRIVRAFCGPTDYKKPCAESLSPLTKNNTANPKDYLQLAITAAVEALNGTIDKSLFISKQIVNREQMYAFRDCNTMLRYAMEELNRAWKSIGEISLEDMKEKEVDLQNWLSATISYQQSCLDIVDPPFKEPMKHGMQNASELTSNVLAMITDSKNIFKTLGIAIDKYSTVSNRQRRLLADLSPSGYPEWVSADDRRLLDETNNGSAVKPNAVVALDGSEKFKTIAAAVASYPKRHKGRYIIYVKAGVYEEQISVHRTMEHIFMYGDGPKKTIVHGRLNKVQGTNTWRSATFAVVGNGFICKSMGFQNTAGPQGRQAVALRVQSDQSVFFNCRVDGYQGSLYAQAHRQFYRNCVITGTVDFIFGDSSTIIQNSQIIVRKPMSNQQNTITAQGKSDARESTGTVIQNCEIVPEKSLFKNRFQIQSFLGRPFKEYSTTVIMESTLADFIHPSGWMAWEGNFGVDTVFYGEYSNQGPGSNTTNRVDWKGFKVIKDRNEALNWTVGRFLQGQGWIPQTSTPFTPGLEH